MGVSLEIEIAERGRVPRLGVKENAILISLIAPSGNEEGEISLKR